MKQGIVLCTYIEQGLLCVGPSRKEESLPASPAVEAISGLPKAKGKGSTGRVTEKEVPQERPAGSIKKKPAKKAQNKLEQKEATKDSAETKVNPKSPPFIGSKEDLHF